MPKTTTKFVCQSCGAEFSRWQGKCDSCGEWNSLVETVMQGHPSVSKKAGTVVAQSLDKISDLGFNRFKTGIDEVDRVLGGGIVPGSLILISGDPGVGKSTLVLQIAQNMARDQKVLYISGEESLEQLKTRAKRLQEKISENLFGVAETDLDSVFDVSLNQKPSLMIVDSIQTMSSAEITSVPGSVSQISYCTNRLMTFCKKNHIACFVVGHVTKEGAIAGPKILEHMVDVVLYLEGERYGGFRILRSNKNRFGATAEMGIFEMEDKGLITVENPSKALLAERITDTAGSVVFASIEGTRPLLLEIQALCNVTVFGYPKRTSSGFDLNRLNLLVAVIQKRMGLNLSNQDIYINVVGGLYLKDPAADLAVALAIISAFKNKTIKDNLAVFGEIGLSGEIRSVSYFEKRAKEGEKLGFNTILTAPVGKKFPGAKVLEAKTLSQAATLAM